MTDNKGVQARDQMFESVRRELFGPAPLGEPLIVPPGDQVVDEFKSYTDAETGEEIFSIVKPLTRYGMGILFPQKTVIADIESDQVSMDDDELDVNDFVAPMRPRGVQKNIRAETNDSDEEEGTQETIDISKPQPSTFGVSFRVSSSPDLYFEVKLPESESASGLPVNGRYEEFPVIGKSPKSNKILQRNWWVRKPVSAKARFKIPATIKQPGQVRLEQVESSFENVGPLSLKFSAFARRYPRGADNDLIITVVIENRTVFSGSGGRDAICLFQSHLEVVISPEVLCALPGEQITDAAAASLNLIYAHEKDYAVGHGCAADWNLQSGVIVGTHFPTFETPTMTSNLTTSSGKPLVVSMVEMANPQSASFHQLEVLLNEYERWIQARKGELSLKFQDGDFETASRHVRDAETMLGRMKRGFEIIRSDDEIRLAFQLMNKAMLIQQMRTKSGAKRTLVSEDDKPSFRFEPGYFRVDLDKIPANIGNWRPFQIGFILAALESTAFGASPDREIVDLIWFPTGGGKTEAYLGLAAFSMLLRRLRNPEHHGTDILMRYTLRLLTAQQFQRASSLICALEYMRTRGDEELGSRPFEIGLWVGGSTTPNTWEQAKTYFQALADDRSSGNPFLLTECPWCKAEMGPQNRYKDAPKLLGYEFLRHSGQVILHCPDQGCDFHEKLPVQIVDEGIYENPPSMIIGTVDKFARLSWDSRARAMFGINSDGDRFTAPPNLIIQDELHLISGPLGTMVGAYEAIIEYLCTHKYSPAAAPKIVCSTATIRNYSDQNRWLFARENTAIFPPPMFSVDDSFFGVREKNPDGTAAPGRKYVGVFANGRGSHMSSQVEVYAASLQSVLDLEPEARDPYWTILGFFNTLRDLGSTTTLLQDQVQQHLLAIWRRQDLLAAEDVDKRRRTSEPIELTGRLRQEEVPQALSRLMVNYNPSHEAKPAGQAVDVCLASNMIEVGIDIDRLGLMIVTGQPKTNSQYIQVTGRVGRDARRRPGLVFVVYNVNRARDKSVFETFRSNHARMYASVEPASVTPFSLPALKRMLHALMVGFIKQTRPVTELESPEKVELEHLSEFKKLMENRVRLVDAQGLDDFQRVYESYYRDWDLNRPTKWHNYSDLEDDEVLYVPAGGSSDDYIFPWKMPQSLRNVDAECLVDRTRAFEIESRGN